MANSGDRIVVRGARVHNLKSVDVTLPRNALIVFTGLSGSGKSSLAFDTLYAEGQRRYVESLSSYTRQFLGQLQKPDVDYLSGLSPTISIEQKSAGANPRSTVATVTEIHDYLRVLYARVGVPHCHLCQKELGAQSLDQIVARLLAWEGRRAVILAPLARERKGEYREMFEQARGEGFARVRVNGETLDLEQEIKLDRRRKHNIELVMDRLTIARRDESRLSEAVEAALERGEGLMIADVQGEGDLLFSNQFACPDCGVSFEELTPQMFSFNSPQGMCPDCAGLGTAVEADPAFMVPDESLSIRQGAVRLWGSLDEWHKRHAKDSVHMAERLAAHFGIDLGRPWRDLTERRRKIVLYGSRERIPVHWKHERGEGRRRIRYEGVVNTAHRRYKQTHSPYMRRHWGRYLGEVTCRTCDGTRLRPESAAVTFAGRRLPEVIQWSVGRAAEFFSRVRLRDQEWAIAEDLCAEITARLGFLVNVGLHYLTLDRPAPSLSGGEAQRVRLASQIGAGLSEVLYVLDEPSIGLHQRDNERLLDTLCELRDQGNTVIVVEHDRQTIETADRVVDFGPGAGHEGGEIVVSGSPGRVRRSRKSATGRYLRHEERIELPAGRRSPNGQWLILRGASHHNLKQIDVPFALGTFTCVTGVSGSGKSSLVNETLVPALARELQNGTRRPGRFVALEGLEHVDKIVGINQKPIGRTPRSNPATYVKAFDPIRQLFAQLPEARARGYKPGHFSFNVRGGRCDTCQGNGELCVPMHLMPDIWVTCDDCRGARFKRETLDVRFKGRHIAEVLDLTVAEALELFENQPRIARILGTLHDVGMGYVRLGQPAPTLSGGEAQRIKLARELSKIATGRTIYVLDEPTTGLHFEDIRKLLVVLQRFVEAGNTVIAIEHNLDVVKAADYVIDLGPEGGDEGGYLIGTGTPEEIAATDTCTGRWLRRELEEHELGRGRPPSATA